MAHHSAARQRIAMEQVQHRQILGDQHIVFEFERIVEVEEPAPAPVAATRAATAAEEASTAAAGTTAAASHRHPGGPPPPPGAGPMTITGPP